MVNKDIQNEIPPKHYFLFLLLVVLVGVTSSKSVGSDV